MAQLLPKLVKTVRAGFVKCFDALDWITRGVEVETCPRDLKGAKSASRWTVFCVEAEATVWFVLVRGRFEGGAIVVDADVTEQGRLETRPTFFSLPDSLEPRKTISIVIGNTKVILVTCCAWGCKGGDFLTKTEYEELRC